MSNLMENKKIIIKILLLVQITLAFAHAGFGQEKDLFPISYEHVLDIINDTSQYPLIERNSINSKTSKRDKELGWIKRYKGGKLTEYVFGLGSLKPGNIYLYRYDTISGNLISEKRYNRISGCYLDFKFYYENQKLIKAVGAYCRLLYSVKFDYDSVGRIVAESVYGGDEKKIYSIRFKYIARGACDSLVIRIRNVHKVSNDFQDSTIKNINLCEKLVVTSKYIGEDLVHSQTLGFDDKGRESYSYSVDYGYSQRKTIDLYNYVYSIPDQINGFTLLEEIHWSNLGRIAQYKSQTFISNRFSEVGQYPCGYD